MDLFNTGQPSTFLPGQRIARVKGFDAFDKFQLPRDCEGIFLDEDEDVCYIKRTDSNGNVSVQLMYDMTERELPKFDPAKYISKKEFDEFKGDVLNGINDLKQVISNFTAKPAGNSKRSSTVGDE